MLKYFISEIKKHYLYIFIYYLSLFIFLSTFNIIDGTVKNISLIGKLFCPFEKITGISCPLCGISRSVAYASRFEIMNSLKMHLMGIPVLIFLIFLPILILLNNYTTNTKITLNRFYLLFAVLFIPSWIFKLYFLN